MTDTQIMQGIDRAALSVGVPSSWLYNLIKFETAGTFDPLIKNKNSSARGLIQFTDSAARAIGFSDSEHLVTSYPGFDSQLQNAVVPYLLRYFPFPTKQSLYMAVFYPVARAWPLSAKFPESVQSVNPGIVTVGNYVGLVDGIGKYYYLGIAAFAAGVFLVYNLLKRW